MAGGGDLLKEHKCSRQGSMYGVGPGCALRCRLTVMKSGQTGNLPGKSRKLTNPSLILQATDIARVLFTDARNEKTGSQAFAGCRFGKGCTGLLGLLTETGST